MQFGYTDRTRVLAYGAVKLYKIIKIMTLTVEALFCTLQSKPPTGEASPNPCGNNTEAFPKQTLCPHQDARARNKDG